jgi:methyl-accepting chemotaxis protein
MGIRSRLILIMGLFSLVSTLFIGFASYKVSERNALIEAKNKGQLLFDYIISYRQYFKEHQRALILELVDENRFYPELMSDFVATRGIWDVFRTRNDQYHFKQATIDPLYEKNRADDSEMKIINSFQQHTDLKGMEGVIEKGKEKFFYMAFPIRITSKKCLRCHGDPMDAPKDQIEIYGTESGYNWKFGDTVSAYIVYVSIQKAMQEAKKTAGILFLVGIGSFFVVLVGVALFMSRSIIRPVEYLSDRTEEIIKGRYLDEKIEYQSNDEIGVLARVIEHLRVNRSKRKTR